MIYKTPSGLQYKKHLIELIQENHTLIAGTTGSGKSVLENAIIYALLCSHFPGNVDNGNGCKFVLIDPKKVELIQYKDLPHTWIYADNISDIENALYNVRLLIDNRLKAMQSRRIRKSSDYPVYVFIDELVDLVTSNRSKQIIDSIKDSISIARACNVFFVILTQAPNRKILKPEIVLNCNCRVALRCNNAIESRQILADDTATLIDKYGVGIAQQNTERYTFTIPFYSDIEIDSLVRFWEKQHPIYRKFQKLLNHRT